MLKRVTKDGIPEGKNTVHKELKHGAKDKCHPLLSQAFTHLVCAKDTINNNKFTNSNFESFVC
jgi:hypothetical protein